MEYKVKSFSTDVLSSVQNTLQSTLKPSPTPSPEKQGWIAWLKPVWVSLATLSVRYLVSLCCHMLPGALFNMTLLGPCLKLIIHGPEGFFVEPLTPGEIQERFQFLSEAGQSLNNNCVERNQNTTESFAAIATALELMRDKIRILESGRSINTINNGLGDLPRARTQEELDNQVSDLLSGISRCTGEVVPDAINDNNGIFDD